jgi:ABC-type phosphate/phosphonate transport system substrate-binding protein
MGRWPLFTLLLIVLTGCGALASQQAGPTPRPIATVTPMSTPLAYPATPQPVGSVENPLRWVMVPADAQAAEPLRATLSELLSEALGVVVEVELVTTMGDVIAQVCTPSLEQVTMGTVDALGYAIVNARGCANPAMRFVSGTSVGDEILIVTRQAESLEAARSLNLPFCRLSSTDLESWVLPTLLLRTLRQDESALGQTLDRRSYTESLRTIGGGGCWGAAVPARVYNPLRTAQDPLVEGMRVLERTPRLPYGVVMIPSSVPLELQADLIALLEEQTRAAVSSAAAETTPDPEATADPEATPDSNVSSISELAAAFFGEYRLAAVDGNDLAAVDRFFAQTQLDFARLGR